uniref:asparaginase n=1 Tax=Callorhinchus milii TaxID=7868 RepID=A0A4W3INC2_CALMI|eukprot:gi/632942496/ref/XP_007886442.1/ PREDICTED: 60 kDa lysophospholipase [Callorhinchus milii]
MSSPELQQLALELSTAQNETKKKVFVIYTGGTIGMKEQEDGLKPVPGALVPFLRTQPSLHDPKYPEKLPENTLVLPLSRMNMRVIYTVSEYDPLLDSSNMNAKDWAKIASDIQKNYGNYDGFVVLHGTDTMAYTSSALSFICKDHQKSIVLTGSQVPIYEPKNDARDNLLGALLIASQFQIPEVTLYFNHKLFRGNRVTKVDATNYAAFDSPNYPPLLNAAKDFKVDWDLVWDSTAAESFDINTDHIPIVRLLKIFPGFDANMVRAVLSVPAESVRAVSAELVTEDPAELMTDGLAELMTEDPAEPATHVLELLKEVKGAVVESFGAGNSPNDPKILQEFKQAVDRGVLIMNCTQCLKGTVTMDYNTGQLLEEQGLIPGRDMTPEAAIGKLFYVLGKKDLTPEARREMLKRSIRGEMTIDRKIFQEQQ